MFLSTHPKDTDCREPDQERQLRLSTASTGYIDFKVPFVYAVKCWNYMALQLTVSKWFCCCSSNFRMSVIINLLYWFRLGDMSVFTILHFGR